MMMTETAKVLLVEDNPGDARLIREMLLEAGGNAFELEWVSQLSEGLERLSAGKVDLVLLDLGLPDSRGIDTFSRAYARAPEVPFVLMTGLDDEVLALTAIRQGAQDYLVKGETNSKLLLRAMRYATERKRAELALENEQKKLFSVLNSLPAFIHLKGADFKICFGNRRFTELFGEPGAKPCYEVIRGKSEPCEDCRVLKVLKTKEPQKFEWTSPLNDSTYEICHYPFNVDGDPLILTLGVDVTDRKLAEDEIKRQSDLLRTLAARLSKIQEIERQQLARELHDQVCQNLATMGIMLASLKIRTKQEPLDRLMTRIESMSALVEQTGEITRDLIEGLRPTVLDHYGLMRGLRQLGSQFSQWTGIDLEILGEEAGSRLSPNVELALFRIAQEALNNVAKHAQASQVALTKEADHDSVRLIIADNGIGFEQNLVDQPKEGRGWGLITMTERARAVGGHCRIESQPGQGTRVVVEVPR